MTFLWLALSVVLLLLAGWLRSAGTAVTRVPRADALRDDSEGVAGANLVAKILEDREVIAPAIGAVGSALLIVSASLGVAVSSVGEAASTALWRAIIVASIVFLLGDLLPRRLGRVAPHQIAYRSARPLSLAVRLGGWANDLISETDDVATEEPDEVEEEHLDEQERELIDSVLGFSETLVREAMTPRPDMVTITLDATIDEVVSLASEEGFSRLPVVSDSDVVGLIIVKDLLPLFAKDRRPASIAEVMRSVDFVPETKLASNLLSEMRASRTHQMVVVDEYGDITGLITIEDLLEELVGEIADETDDEEIMFYEVSQGLWAVDARMSVEDLGDELDVELPDDEWDTVGGLVLGIAERVPEEGEEFSVGEVRFTVTRMQGRRVAELEVVRAASVESA